MFSALCINYLIKLFISETFKMRVENMFCMCFNWLSIGWRVKTYNFHQKQILQIRANMAITCVLKVFGTNSFETTIPYKVFFILFYI